MTRPITQDEHLALMFWKLCLGNPNQVMFQKDSPAVVKTERATADSWTTQPMPQEGISRMDLSLPISADEMDILRMGHIPEVQEDHWFMYCTDDHIRYFRSWTGDCMFEAHFRAEGAGFLIDSLLINHALLEFHVNGDESAAWLFRYLLTAEIGGDASDAWHDFTTIWKYHNIKH